MTREDVIEMFERFVIGAKPCSQREIVDACASAYRMLKEQPSLPSNLDEAAERMAWDIAPDYPDISWDTCFEKIKAGIKAGAEWMAGQGENVEGVFKAGDPGYPDIRMGEQYSIEHILRKPGGIEPGDEVVVQIRKM